MNHRLIIEKGKFETFRAQQGVFEVGDGDLLNHRTGNVSRQEVLDELTDLEIGGLIKARDRVDRAPNVIARFFAHRRYKQLHDHAVELCGEDEVADFLTTKVTERF